MIKTFEIEKSIVSPLDLSNFFPIKENICYEIKAWESAHFFTEHNYILEIKFPFYKYFKIKRTIKLLNNSRKRVLGNECD